MITTLGLAILSAKSDIEPRSLYAGTVFVDIFMLAAAVDISTRLMTYCA